MNEHVHTPNVTLGQMVRTRLATGSLFLLGDGTVNAGRGTGKLCTVCGMPIFATEVENEVLRLRTAYVHSLCHSIWLQESSAFQEPHTWLKKSAQPGPRGSTETERKEDALEKGNAMTSSASSKARRAKTKKTVPMTRRAYDGWRYSRTPFYVRGWRYSPIMSVSLAPAILFLIAKLVLNMVRGFIG